MKMKHDINHDKNVKSLYKTASNTDQQSVWLLAHTIINVAPLMVRLDAFVEIEPSLII